MSHKRVEELMKKYPPRFMFDFHPIRFAKKISEGNKKTKKKQRLKRNRRLELFSHVL